MMHEDAAGSKTAFYDRVAGQSAWVLQDALSVLISGDVPRRLERIPQIISYLRQINIWGYGRPCSSVPSDVIL